jgi:hypothetical protein
MKRARALTVSLEWLPNRLSPSPSQASAFQEAEPFATMSLRGTRNEKKLSSSKLVRETYFQENEQHPSALYPFGL